MTLPLCRALLVMTLPLCRALLVLDHSPAHLAQMRGLWSAQSVCEIQACH
jgi:hypothetical protein